jgi:glycosyltransferase involved in cell wall biosynthesis
MRLVIDLTGLQSLSRFRGIGRYTRGLSAGLLRTAGEHEVWLAASENRSESLDAIRADFADLVPEHRIVTYRTLDCGLYWAPEQQWRRRASELVREHFLANLQADVILFSSMFEGFVGDVLTSEGSLCRNSLRAVIAYDLIPARNPEKYLCTPEIRTWYYDKLTAFGNCDLFLAISGSAGREVSQDLNIDPQRITSIMGGADDFVAKAVAFDPVNSDLELRLGISRPFFVYTASFESRKNFENLVAAFGRFSAQVGRPHQLVLVTSAVQPVIATISSLAQEAGLGPTDVVVTGQINDDDLVELYRRCVAMVYPSRHEGFGLPILEAMHFDAAVIGSNTSSIPEIINLEEALFDPDSVEEIAAKMSRIVHDDAFRQRLKENAIERRALFTWDSTALTTWRALEEAIAARAASAGPKASPDAHYRALIGALKALPQTPQPPAENDLRALSNAIATNIDTIAARVHGGDGTGIEPTPRLALDMYVLAQDVRTGVYRVCDELFPRLAKSPQVNARLFYRDGGEAKAAPYVAAKGLAMTRRIAIGEAPSANADILLSPFGVAPADWLLDPRLLHAHIIYDLIAINRPEFFSAEAAAEVHSIVDSLDEHTVVFAISEFTKKDLLARRPDLSPRQITVIPLAAGSAFRPCNDISARAAVRSKYGIPAEIPYVLSLATLEIRKNLDQVVKAFVLFLEQNEASQMHLVLSGMSGWKLEQLKSALAAAHKWRHRIVLTGFVEDEDLSALYSDALCFVYLSRYEGFGLPPLEAMACGTPVIAADNSSLPEVVGQAGLMLDADDVQGVANALRKIEASGEFRQRLGNAGLERAKLFSWERCAEIVVDTLCDAYARHLERPSDRRSRILAPGALTTNAMRADGTLEANFLDYQNGSRGPLFSGVPRVAPASRAETDWPKWKDRLQTQPGTDLIEGGLRTRGMFKTGTEQQPLVTYVTVVRNNTATLARTIESVQSQTYANVEHVVLDGASTDGTLDVIRQYADRLDYFASEPDRGLYDAVNKAIPLARGQLICVLNSDDWLEPRAAEIAVHRMAQVKGAALLLTGAKVRRADASMEWYPAFVHPGCYFRCADDCHNGIYATPAAYEISGPYDTLYKIAADFKWIMTCLDADTTFVYTREMTVNYSLGGVSSNEGAHSLECMRLVGEHFPTLTQSDITGLYDCFFRFQNLPDLPDRLVDRIEFLKDLFARHASQPDFLQALAWASIEKIECAQASTGKAAIAMPTEGISTVIKSRVKDNLRAHPLAYKVVRRAYSLIRKRQ